MVPSLPALAVLAAALFMKPAAAPPDPPPDVRLTVAEESPERWRLRIENAGSVPVRVMADARLLSLEVTAAGAKKAVRCTLPDDMRPAQADERALVVPPQRAYVESFDPRVYCFGATEAAALAPGATVVAHLGWPAGPKGRAATGPFAVEPLEGVAPPVAPARELVAPAWTIAALAAADTANANANANATETPALMLSTREREDAPRAADIGVTVTLVNHGKKPITTLLRTETLAFDVTGPGGIQRCGGTRAVDSPIRELYDTLAPKGHASISLLLKQVCPRRTFELPGIYTVTAVLDTRRASGRPAGLVTFDGVVTATKPTRVRLHKTRWSSPATRPALD